jgi:hypothetical protein
MDTDTLLFWQAGPAVKLSPSEVARELVWGEEVEGLVDLSVRQILDRIKLAFPQHEEKPGLLTCQGATGSFEVTWTWQFLKVECHDLVATDRERLVEEIGSFGCTVFDPSSR